MRNSFLLPVALSALFLVASCGKSENAPANAGSNLTLTAEQRRNITLTTVMSGRFHRNVDTTGIVDFDNNQATAMLAPFSGTVSQLLVEPGQEVKKGEALARVVSPDYASAVSTYRKALVTAQNARKLADLDKDLLAHQGVSTKEAEQAETDAASAEADRDAGLQALQSLGVDASVIRETKEGKDTAAVEGTIRSPIAGTVVEKLIQPGQLLQASTTPVFTVADLSKVWVMAHIFDTDLGAVHRGDSAQVSGAGKTLHGLVDNIAAEVDPNTRSIAVRIVVDNPGEFLKRQMYVQVGIEDRQEAQGLLVPVSAILHDDENLPYVYVEQSDGSFARAHVDVGSRSGGRYNITSGLRPGQRVVTDGALFLQFMQQQ
ncbi:MAG TPA: efflux RND transporter periplasmic adaptor subunit [Rhizomicrobium sp.]|jgi:cobalt-zinc-cadmium efflux system membrane fusion protein|nr:efflux RND transporter periplasmic adaptor subunit [Rhizomicrobium sp.]